MSPISISDLETDPSGGPGYTGLIGVALEATHGTITLHQTTDLIITKGDGSDDAKIWFAGSTNAINAALDGLVFHPTSDGVGNLLIAVNDYGKTGFAGYGLSGGSVDICINYTAGPGDVNDAPINTVPTAQTTADNTPIVFSGAGKTFSVSDLDAGDSQISVRLFAPQGSFTLSHTKDLYFSEGDGINDGRMAFWGTVENVN